MDKYHINVQLYKSYFNTFVVYYGSTPSFDAWLAHSKYLALNLVLR
jgi:hypothetical protein